MRNSDLEGKKSQNSTSSKVAYCYQDYKSESLLLQLTFSLNIFKNCKFKHVQLKLKVKFK
jgi:hypothetical protein